MSKRTITLTDHAPINIEEASWPIIAKASDKEHDGEVECQANRISTWFLRVRQHQDGRAIVYGGYDYDSHWRGERDYNARRGIMLTIGEGEGARPTMDDIISAIREVCEDIASAECNGDDAARWPTLAAECIADLPAVEVE